MRLRHWVDGEGGGLGEEGVIPHRKRQWGEKALFVHTAMMLMMINDV